MTNLITGAFGLRQASGENMSMLRQFWNTLRAIYASLPDEDPDWPSEVRNARKTCGEVLELDRPTWEDAYMAEELLAYVRPWSSLEEELHSQAEMIGRVSTARKTYFHEALKALQDKYKIAEQAAPKNETEAFANPYYQELRQLLRRVLDDAHWRYAQRYRNRLIYNVYALRLFLTSCVLAISFLGVLILPANTFAFPFSPYAALEIAILAGLLGASFSMLTGRPFDIDTLSIEEMRRLTGFPYMMLRIGIGAIGSVIVYFAVRAGIIESVFLPDLEKIGFTVVNAATRISEDLVVPIRVPNIDLCQLVVWSVVAGFFEKIVPTILGRLQQETNRNGASQ